MYRICYFIFLLCTFSSLAQNNSTLIPFQHSDGSYGYKDESGSIVIEPQYESAKAFRGAYAGAKANGSWGLVTSRGKWAIPAKYEDIGWTVEKEAVPAVSGEVTGYKQQGKWGLISVRNKVITPPTYEMLAYFSPDYIKAGKIVTQFQQTDTLFGLIDTKGNEIIPIVYHSLAVMPQAGIILAGINRIYNADNSSVQAYGLLSTSHQVLLPLEYANISQGKPGTVEVTSFPAFHWTDAKGQIKSKVAADSLYEISQHIFAFTWQGKTGIYTAPTSTIRSSFDQVFPSTQGYVLYRSKNKYGALTRNGDTLQTYLPARYDSLVILSGQYIKAGIRQQDNWEWELVSANAANAQPIKSKAYHFIDAINDSSYIRVRKDKLYGFINSSDEQSIPLQFDSLGNFIDSVCVAVQNGKAGILKKDGSWYLPPTAERYQISTFGYFIRQEKGRWDVLDKAGKKQYTSPIPLNFVDDGSIAFRQKGKVGRLNPGGVLCVPAVYDSVSVMSGEGTFWAFEKSNIFLYDREGTMLVKEPKKIEQLKYVPHQYSLVRTGGRYGYVDERGRLRISNRYDGGQPFAEGLAAVRLSGKWGFVNNADKIAIQPYYEEVTPFQGGFSIAKKGKKWGLLDKNGKETAGFTYDRIIRDTTGVFITEKGGKQGLLGKNGVESIYVKYEKLTPLPDGNVRMEVQGKYGLLTSKGIVLLPATYDGILYNRYSQTYLLLHKPISFELTIQQILSGELARQK
ncbi:WG repeat-containing protein [Rhodocytophaga rosea]|uniref:WG repeat-containing protein n=1 Tax=Rhodocytophaga rosea TaxID=2704465 RepID=A0A6C0GP79_9BACT|nr:WG repeat-containing protein [Rhodocytophaga rosea]QHT69846.1 WG repeat-containing protein [Rhodocytophaga rosea]